MTLISHYTNMFLLFQDELEKISPLLLKLGLLFQTGTDTASTRNQPTYLSFHHKIFHEYSGAYFVNKTIEKSHDVQVKISVSSAFMIHIS